MRPKSLFEYVWYCRFLIRRRKDGSGDMDVFVRVGLVEDTDSIAVTGVRKMKVVRIRDWRPITWLTCDVETSDTQRFRSEIDSLFKSRSQTPGYDDTPWTARRAALC